ncbi:taste receptor type 1 member 3 [Calypte anna]|uniref:Taste receptor type 1 member 3 n=1 Tax=Calypte anna TaxID=9244 RepID=A0A088DCH0_CALAN|nr:taste receptor type 1 member 3 [Calypte anna]AIL54466.1 taste receptor type 1 member 3 [Calypte anna]
MVPTLLLGLSFGYAAAQETVCLSAQFRSPGDYILGGLFPFGMDIVNLTARTEPTSVKCERLFVDGLIWALGMKFAINEINNSSSLLPGVKLGYDMHDTCFEQVVTLQSSLLFLTQKGTTGIEVSCNYTNYQPRVTAVIGPYKSDLCLLTAKLFSFFLLPQISYGGSIEKLSNTDSYPSFYRTVPGDNNLVEAVAQLLNKFGWNWIITIGSNDEYGRGAQGHFVSIAENRNICIAFESLIPTDLADPKTTNQLENIIKAINKTDANVIVLFAFSQTALALLEHSIRMGLSKRVWIGTETWTLSHKAASISNIQSIGTVLGFVMKAGTVPGFHKYVTDLFSSAQHDEFCQQSRKSNHLMSSDVLSTPCEQCDYATLPQILPTLNHLKILPVYLAVYSVANALHRALGCTHQACPKAPLKSWQLLHFMNTFPFTVNGQSFRFDKFHGTNPGYQLIFWLWRNGTLEYLPVGEYKESLAINVSQIQFHTPNQERPSSQCFAQCLPGQIRQIKGLHYCCYDCRDCPENTFSSAKDQSRCTSCQKQQWAPTSSIQCYDRSERYLFWNEPLTIALLLGMSLTLSLTCATALIFLKNLETPLVQASGGKLNLFGLFMLTLQSLSCCLYVGKPSDNLCTIQQIVYALCLNGSFSTFFIKSLEIILVTEFPRCAPTFLPWLTQRRAWLLVALCLLIQSFLSFCYVQLGPDYLQADYESLRSEVLLVCDTKSWFAFTLLQGYNCCLAFVCFLCTFMVQTSGKQYNIARGITFAILTYFIIWIFFVAIFTTLKTVLRPATQMGTILATSLGILGTYYIPKCYLILLKPELNKVDYFQHSIKEEPDEDSQ